MRGVPLLLVSVTDADEAVVALENGADILDVKRPEEGSLGAPFPDVLRAVVARRDGRGGADAGPPPGMPVRVSAALGDAPDLPGSFALAAAGAIACGADDIKIGLRGPRSETDAIEFLRAVARGLGTGAGGEDAIAGRPAAIAGHQDAIIDGGRRRPASRLIAAAYADAAEIGALDPRLLVRVAARAGVAGCLIDTFHKDGRTLFDHLTAGDLARFVADCRAAGLVCGLAGSLTAGHLPLLFEAGPDFVGVRGAICSSGRRGRIDPVRLRSLRTQLRSDAADFRRDDSGLAASR